MTTLFRQLMSPLLFEVQHQNHPRNTHHEGHSRRADSAVQPVVLDTISLELSVALP